MGCVTAEARVQVPETDREMQFAVDVEVGRSGEFCTGFVPVQL